MKRQKAEVMFEDGAVVVMDTDPDLLDELVKEHGLVVEARPVTDNLEDKDFV